MLLIKVSEVNNERFKVSRFLLMSFYHAIFFFLTPIVASIIIYILEGFDTHLIYNLRLAPQINPSFFVQFIASIFMSYSIFYYYKFMSDCKDDEANECIEL